MKKFMDEDFLLQTDTARHLYHEHAEKMPIVDYHCHVSPREIAENHQFRDITEAWLGGDHYKWRLIRSNGVEEKFITGDASPREKFQKFAEVLPRAIGNPLYHWTHLELKRYFDYDKPLTAENAEEVWKLCNEKLASPAMRVQKIIEKSNVKVLCTTDDPADDLAFHKKINEEGGCTAKVLPALRPDKALGIEQPTWKAYMEKLSRVVNVELRTMQDVRDALGKRIEAFSEHGCRAADHGLTYVMYRESSEQELNKILQRVLQGEAPTMEETEKYKTALLCFLGAEYAKRGWAMQIHYSAMRNPNTRMFQKLGADVGHDCIGIYPCAEGLVKLLDALEREGKLPRTILYSLNPSDNAMIGSIIGAFQGSEVPGKVQQGAAWWFNDTKAGMEKQLESIANLSVFGNILGMLTDSRSFLSYTRHEYYRRILCNFIGNLVENGEYPKERKLLGTMVEDICYNNAIRYFCF